MSLAPGPPSLANSGIIVMRCKETSKTWPIATLLMYILQNRVFLMAAFCRPETVKLTAALTF